MQKIDNFIFTGSEYEPYFKYWKRFYTDYSSGYFFKQKSSGSLTQERLLKKSSFVIPHSDTQIIYDLVGKNDSGVFLILFAVTGILLNKYSGKDHVIIDTPLYNLKQEEKLFTQRVPLLLDVNPEESLKELLAKCQNILKQSYKYQNFPLELLHNAFDTDQIYRSNVLVRYKGLHNTLANDTDYDLIIDIERADETLSFKLQYAENTFDAYFIESLEKHVIQLLKYFNTTDVLIRDAKVLSKEEENYILHQFNNLKFDYAGDRTIQDLFEEQVLRTPDSLALIFEDQELTYKELNERANSLAHYLRETYQIQKDDLIGLLVDRSERMIIAILAILKAGAAYLPIDAEYPTERKEFILSDANIRLLLTESAFMFNLGNYDGGLFILDLQLSEIEKRKENLQKINSSDDLAYVIYTSGSTGHPKGVMIEHRSNVNMSSDQIRQFGITGKDKVLQFASLAFDASVSEIFMALYSGATLVLVNKQLINEPELFIKYMRDKEVTVITFPPSYFSLLDIEKLRFLRVIITAGEAARIKDASHASQFCDYFNAYGPTECAVCVSINKLLPDNIYTTTIPIGKPIANMEVYILDKCRHLVPVGVEGEIFVSGAGLARGYLNRSELTEEKFIPNPFYSETRMYHTGDLGRWLDDGTIEFIGRRDFQVKIKGYRIELGEIESTLLRYTGIKDVAVVARQDKKKSTYLAAYYSSDEPFEVEVLRQYLGSILPSHMIPERYISLPELPFNTSGKIDRKALPDPELSRGNLKTKYVAPENIREQKMVSIWEEALNKTNIGVLDNFFYLGGDSIKSIKLVSLINKEFNIAIEVKDVFNFQDVLSLTQYIDQELNSDARSQELTKARHEIEAFKNEILNNPEFSSALPQDWEDFYPMSDIQKGMLYHSLLDVTSAVYHDQMFHQLEDPSFDFGIFRTSLKLLTIKHNMLRTSFDLAKFNHSIQIVHQFSEKNLDMEFLDIQHLQKNEQKIHLQNYLKSDLNNPLRYEKPGLWRIRIFKLSETEYGILFVCHHAIIDGWSDASLFTELSNIYYNLKQNPEYTPDFLKAGYKDYIIDQHLVKNSETIKEFWKDDLQGYQRVDLPFHKTNNELNSTRKNKTYSFTIDKTICAGLIDYAEENSLSIKHICLTAFKYLLKITTNSNDITIGLVTNGRPDIIDGEKILGCFLNTIPFRTIISPEITGDDLISEIHTKSNHLKSFDKLSLPEILNLSGEKTTTHNPIFDIMFNYVDFYITVDQHENTVVQEPLISGSGNNNTLFGFSVKRINEALRVSIVFLEDLYTAEELKLISVYYTRILRQLVNNGTEALNTQQIIESGEIERLLIDFNNTKTSYPKNKTLHQLFEEQAEKNHDRVALVTDGKILTYRELNEKANQLAHYLQQNLKISPDDLVGVMIEKSEWMILAILGILKSGAAYLPLDTDHPLERKNYMLRETGAKALIVNDDLLDNEQFDVRKIHLKELWNDIASYPKSNPQLITKPSDLAYVIYTSGSTGLPKGVMIEHAACINTIFDHIDRFSVTENDKVMQFFSIAFDASVFEIFLALLSGATLVIPDSATKDAEAYTAFIKAQQVSLVALPPAFLDLIPSDELSFLRVIVTGGESPDVRKAVSCSKHSNYFNAYGPTECSICVSAYEVTDHDENKIRIPVGSPIANTKLYVLDAEMNLLPIGVEGEIYVSGPGLSRGYINDAQLTKKKFVNNPFEDGKIYKTGDIGKWLASGHIEFVRRKDHQVKLRGNRIELGEIENVLLNYGILNEVIALIKEDKKDESYLVAYFTFKEKVNIPDLREYLGRYLPSYMIPAYFVPLKAFPVSINGKIDYKALPDPTNVLLSRSTEYCAPESELEMQLTKIWENILDKQDIGVKDDFFEIGGHSLKAMHVVSKIYEELNVKIELRNLFKNSTIEGLSRFIEVSVKADFKSIPIIPQQDDYPVSHAQKRLWVLDRLEERKTAYNIPDVYIFKGSLNTDAFGKALNTIISRHESLRTVFTTVNEQPRQKILAEDAHAFKLEYIDLRNESEQKEEITKKLVAEQANTIFDLEKGPLLKAKLLQLENESHVFLLTMHHIISDGWSMGVLVKEVSLLYNLYRDGKENTLQPLRIQYKDYTDWQNKQLEGDNLKDYQEYWLNQFEGEIPVLQIATDYPRPAVKTYNGRSAALNLDKELTSEIRDFSRQNGVTIFMTLLATVKVLLYKYSGQEDIIVGSPIVSREHADLEEQIGFYVNTLALRSKFKGTEDFISLLTSIKENTIKAFDYQVYPFDKLVDDLSLERLVDRSPLFDVVVALQNSVNEQKDDEVMEGLSIYSFKTGTTVSKVDLTFNFTETGDDIIIHLIYNEDLFSHSYVQRLLEHYKELVSSCLINSDLPLSHLNYLSADELTKVLYSFNDTSFPYPEDRTIQSLFEEQVLLTPENIALVYGDIRFTYKELNERANQLAHYLRESYEIKEDEVIGLLVNRSERMIIGILGIIKAGAAWLPIDPEYPADRAGYMLANAKSRILLTETDHMFHVMDFHQGELLALDIQLSGLNTSNANPTPLNKATDLAYVIYTSGSTGLPKGVMVEHRSMINMSLDQIKKFGVLSSDNVLQFASLSFDASVSELFMAFYSGATLTLVDKSVINDIHAFATYIFHHNITVATLPPAYLNLLDDSQIRGLRVLITAGESPSLKRAESFNEWIEYYNAYGPTECAVCVSVHKVSASDLARQKIPAGKPIANISVYILDQSLHPVGIGMEGEIWVSGVGLARGYINQDELTGEKFIAHPFKEGAKIYKTGDWGKWLMDGSIELQGRKDSQVKIRGYRIELEEIVKSLQKNEEIEDSIVVSRARSEEKELVAYLKRRNKIELWPSVAEYFVYDDILYKTMAGDELRNTKYRNAIRKVIKGKTVLEIGPGTDVILSRICIEEGARLVYAVEILEEAYQKARRTIDALGLQEKIILIHGDASKITLPEEVDYCVSEIVGSIGGSEGACQIINSVRNKLRDPACMIPERSLTKIAAITLPPEEFENSFEELGAYYVEKIFEQVAYKFDLRICLHSFPVKNIISNDDVFEDLDFRQKNAPEAVHNIHLVISKDSILHGFIVWLNLYCDEQEMIDSLSNKHIWLPVYLPIFSEGYAVRKDDYIKATITRTLSENNLNPDFLIEGDLYSAGMDRVSFSYKSCNTTRNYQQGAFYKKIFSNDVLRVTSALDISKVRDTLSKQLPEYMLPSHFIELKEFPVTLNGKIDYKALPDPDELNVAGEYTEPGNIKEETLVAIWQSILGRQNIGIKDNFFEIGGDSIKAIQISSRMHNYGYKVEVRDIFQYPTIEKLAAIVVLEDRVADQGIILGGFPFTPIQKEFFEWNLKVPHHFNQSVMLYSAEGYKEEAILAIFYKLQEHHDILRTTYPENNDSVTQYINSPDFPVSLVVYDLRDVTDASTKLAYHVNQIQANINLKEGPLMKLGLFHLEDGDRLLIVIHHLLIDGVSWRILFEDINSLLKQYANNEELALPLKTDSYKLWAESLSAYADSASFSKEKDYWANIENQKVSVIKRDIENNESRIGDTGSQMFVLSEEETEALLTKVNNRFNTEINDVLLTALGLGLKQVFKADKIAIALEGHGRESLFEEINISRTVGWFTSFYPVVLDFSNQTNLARQLKEIKENIRQIPSKGVGYGILKHLTSKTEPSSEASRLKPQISFNYLGQFDSDVSNSSIEFAKESGGATISKENQKIFDLDVSGIISAGQLKITIRYSTKHFKAATIHQLLQGYQSSLKDIIKHCTADQKRELTPSDFTYKKLSIDALEKLNKEYDIEDIYTLAPMQEGILFHHLYDRESTAYFNQVSYRLHGELQPDAVKDSFNELLKRHDILRTAFIYDNVEQYIQIVIRERKIVFHFEDVRQLQNKDEKLEYVKSFKHADKKHLFDLSKDSLMRVAILQLEDQEFELVWSYHHILMDGWCRGIFTTEFFEIYNSLLQDRTNMLSPVTQYKNYIQWLTKQNKSSLKQYWKKYLQGYNELKGISQAAANQFKGGRKGAKQIVFTLDVDRTSALQKLAAKYQVTFNTLFQTIWGINVSKYTNTSDIIFGAVVSGRPSEIKGIESMIGLFLNTIPVRINYDDTTTFNELLSKVQLNAIESESYHHFPLAEIQAESELKINLLDHILTFENYPLADQIEGVMKNSESNQQQVSFGISNVSAFEETNYDLNLIIVPGRQLRIKFDYNPFAYSDEFISVIGQHLSNIIDQVLNKETINVNDILLLTLPEQLSLLAELNDTQAPYPSQTLQGLFENQVENNPETLAVEFGDTSITYKELNERANQLAHYLRKEYQIQPDDLVAILAESAIERVVGIIAVLKSGAAYVPLDTRYPQERVAFLISDTRAKAVLIDAQIGEETLPNSILIGATQLWDSYSKENPVSINTPGNLAYVIYTSGSTGTPKGVMVAHEGVVNRINWMWKEYNFSERDVILQKTPYVFDVSVWELFMPLCYGAKLVLCKKDIIYDAYLISECIEKHKVSTVHFVPSMLNKFISEIDSLIAYKLKPLRHIMASGETLLPKTVEEHYQKLSIPLHNLYGPTEASVDVTYYETSPNDRIIPIGKPISNIELYVVNKNLDILPKGVYGEIMISGIGLAKGYLNREDLTKEKFICNPYKPDQFLYKTGDTGRWLNDGNIEYFGRNDTQIKIRGYRIELGEIENVLLDYGQIEKVAVIDKEDSDREKYLVVYYESPVEYTSSDLRKYLKVHLPEYMVPAYYTRLDQFPITFSGKVNRKALADLKPIFSSDQVIAKPSNESEIRLTELWQQLLEIDSISVDANFFEIGGHSLKAIKLTSRINKEFSVRLEVKDIFENPTIRDLALKIGGLAEVNYETIALCPEQEFYDASHGQKGIFLKYKYRKEKSAFNVLQIIPFESVDKAELEKALSALIQRHESLRTTFLLVDNEVKQRIHKAENSTLNIEYISLNWDEKISTYIEERNTQPFDLEEGPLLSFMCFHFPDGQDKLVILMDHIISDAWSSEILKQEIIVLYNSFRENLPNQLPHLRVQFKDYAVWQNNLLREDKLQQHKQYWHSLLSGKLPVLKLPGVTQSVDNELSYRTMLERDVQHSFKGLTPEKLSGLFGVVFSVKPLEGASYRTILNQNLQESLYKLSRQAGTSLFAVINASIHILLFKLTRQRDIIIGTPVTLREHTDFQGLIGWFLDTLLIRNKLEEHFTLKEFINVVSKNNAEALQHRVYPFEKILDDLNLPLERISTVFIHLLNFEITSKKDILNFNSRHKDHGTPTFDLNFTFREFNNGIELICDYRKELYSPEVIEYIVQAYVNLISDLVQFPDRQLGKLEMIESNFSG
jgi:amino acid adenylation domain-containing protein/non-ribosomal peptide synthase protein (TIGR01720 family)